MSEPARRGRMRQGSGTRVIVTPRVKELWLIDDDPLVRRTVARALTIAAAGFTVCVFAGIDDADAALAHRHPAGLIVDERLGDDSGHTWILARRDALRDTQVVLCTAGDKAPCEEFAYYVAVPFLSKPLSPAALRLFVERACGPRANASRASLEHWCERHGLSLTESRVAELIAEGVPREALAPRINVAPNTLKHHLARIFRKTGLRGFPALVTAILRRDG